MLEQTVFGADKRTYPSQLEDRKYSLWIGGSILMLEHTEREPTQLQTVEKKASVSWADRLDH